MGDKDADPIKIGYEYELSIFYIFCQDGITNLRKINLTKKALWTGNVTANTSILVSDDDFFGGVPPEGSGRFNGYIVPQFGLPSQGVNAWMKNNLHGGSNRTPAYRGRFGILFQQANWGTTGSAEPVSALLTGDANVDWFNSTKWVTVTGASYAEMNPIHMIYYFATSSRNGMGLSETELDADETDANAFFTKAAQQCYDEGLGLSFLFGGDNTIQDNIQEILDHIDGAFFQDPTDGLFKVTLARDDYTVASLPSLDGSNSDTLEIHDTGRDELVNQLQIEFYSTTNNQIRHVTIHDIGLREAMGGHTVSKKIRYNGANSKDLAIKLGTRDMMALSRPLKRVKIAVDRSFADTKPLSVLKWSDADEGVTDMVMRVRSVKRGGLKNRQIELELIQDVFQYGTEVYTADNDVDWEDPAEIDPEDLSLVELQEAPYWFYWFKFNGIPDEADEGDGAVLIIAARKTNADEFYYVREKLSSESTYDAFFQVGDFCPYGYLDSDGILYDNISSGQITVTLQNGVDLSRVQVGSAALIEDEIYRVDAINGDTGVVTLGVGCVDTVCREHPAGQIVWFFGYQIGYCSDNYVDGNIVDIKLLPKTPYDQLDEGDATKHSITLDARADKPYPPGQFRMNSNFYPTAIMGIANASWKHRDRVSQASELHDEADGTIGPEDGTNYELRWYGENLTTVRLNADTPGQSDAWDYEADDSGLTDAKGNPRYNNTLRLRLWSTRSGLTSHQEHDFTMDRADFGYSFGKYFGGWTP